MRDQTPSNDEPNPAPRTPYPTTRLESRNFPGSYLLIDDFDPTNDAHRALNDAELNLGPAQCSHLIALPNEHCPAPATRLITVRDPWIESDAPDDESPFCESHSAFAIANFTLQHLAPADNLVRFCNDDLDDLNPDAR